MKKIVALVLALVLALSLATVAFAYEDGDTLYGGQNWGSKVYTYVEADDGVIEHLEYVDAEGNVTYYAVVAANGKLWEDGTTPATIGLGAELSKVYYDYEAVAVAASKWSCTTDRHAAGYYVEDIKDESWGDFWFGGYMVKAASSDTHYVNLLVDGKIVKAVPDKTFLKGQHVMCVPTSGEKSVGVGVYEGYCAACGQTLKYTKTNISGAGYLFTDANDAWLQNLLKNVSVSIPVGYMPLLGQYYVAVEQGDATAAATGVSSAKTFDAGVALYAGMALMSVAGSAVVIGKKKEF